MQNFRAFVSCCYILHIFKNCHLFRSNPLFPSFERQFGHRLVIVILTNFYTFFTLFDFLKIKMTNKKIKLSRLSYLSRVSQNYTSPISCGKSFCLQSLIFFIYFTYIFHTNPKTLVPQTLFPKLLNTITEVNISSEEELKNITY